MVMVRRVVFNRVPRSLFLVLFSGDSGASAFSSFTSRRQFVCRSTARSSSKEALLLNPKATSNSPKLNDTEDCFATTVGVSSTNKVKVASAAYLNRLALKNAHRERHSNRYERSWRHWSQLTLDTIRWQLQQRYLPIEADAISLGNLWFSLGQAADKGARPSFQDAGARSGYAIDFMCRARLLADLLMGWDRNPTVPSHWEEEHGSFLPSRFPTCTNTTHKLLSLGGGPGFDYLAAVLVATFGNAATDHTCRVEATVLDYEPGWADLVEAMQGATKEALHMPHDNASFHSCHWGGRCDITHSLRHPANEACLALVPTSNIIVCQYCIAENAVLSKASNFEFWVNVVEMAPVGAVVILTETTHRIWPDMVAALEAGLKKSVKLQGDDCYAEVCFPRVIGRGKNNPQLVIRKVQQRAGDKLGSLFRMSSEQQQLCQGFIQQQISHDRKMDSGWVRQAKKVRGSKV